MWGMFALAVLVAVLLLYVPGAPILRALRLPWFASFACAPFVSIAFASVLSVAYCKAGIPCTWYTVFAPLCIFGLVWLVVAMAIGRGRLRAPFDLRVGEVTLPAQFPLWLSFDAVCMIGAVVCGMLVTIFVYLAPLATPDAYIESFDNVHHLAQVRGFADAAWWTSLGNTLYLGNDVAIDTFTGGGFYPSAWHMVAAALVQLTGVSVAAAMNAANAALCGVVLPLSTFAFLRIIFRQRPGVAACGVVLATASAAGPWYFLVWGPLYPNLMAHCLVPAFLAAFAALFADGGTKPERRVFVCVLVVGFVALAFAQPNGVFSAGVLAAPLCVALAYSKTKKHLLARDMVPSVVLKRARLAAVGMVVAIAVVWTAAYLAPFMQAVVTYRWEPDFSLPEALGSVFWTGYYAGGKSLVGALLVIVGIIVALVRRENRWVVVAYLFVSMIYILCVSTDGPVKQFLGGFWYTDTPRVAAIASIAVVALQANAADFLIREIGSFARAASRGNMRKTGIIASGIVAVVLALGMFAPFGVSSIDDPRHHRAVANPLAVRAKDNAIQYDAQQAKIYNAAERAFVDEVLALIGPDEVVINEPNDGSAYAYGAQGLRTYYRYWRGYDPKEGEKPQSTLIRTRLSSLVRNADVQAAVKEVGAAYVLHLDHGHAEIDIARMWTFGDGLEWRGIDGITDVTPGFDIVLARDDMRLYKIAIDGE